MQPAKAGHGTESCDWGAMLSPVSVVISAMLSFAKGVPADDRTCRSIIDMLASLADDDSTSPFRALAAARWTLPDGGRYNGGYDVPIEVSADHFVEIGYRGERYYKGDRQKDGTVQATFRSKACPNDRHLTLVKPATPEGLRDLLGCVRELKTDLRKRGLCPRCLAFLRLPTAEFCPGCCLKAALDEARQISDLSRAKLSW